MTPRRSSGLSRRATFAGFAAGLAAPALAQGGFVVDGAGRRVTRAPSRRDREVAEAMLERFGVAHLAARPTTMISGGERQLVLIARALAQEPAYVVLDEPTASLDFGNQGKVMRRVRALAEEGLGVLFTTHDPNQATRAADRVLMLRDGAIVASGDARAVTEDALAGLYGAPVEVVRGDDGRSAFLPG
jgi:iron complex transport system ATP-binding protein